MYNKPYSLYHYYTQFQRADETWTALEHFEKWLTKKLLISVQQIKCTVKILFTELCYKSLLWILIYRNDVLLLFWKSLKHFQPKINFPFFWVQIFCLKATYNILGINRFAFRFPPPWVKRPINLGKKGIWKCKPVCIFIRELCKRW